MAYNPINVAAYVAAYSGAIAGMAVGGWISSDSQDTYTSATEVAGAFAQQFDIVWNDTATLNNLESKAITSIVQNEFQNRQPSTDDSFKVPATWNRPAIACAALVLQSDAYFASQGINPGSGNTIGPIQNTYYWEPGFLGTANGSIATPYPLLAPFMSVLSTNPGKGWLLYIPARSDLVQDEPVPDLVEGALVVSGIFPDVSFISSAWVVEQQSGAGPYLAFRELWLSSLELNGPGSVQLNFSNCFVDAINVTGGQEGTATFRDTGAANIAFPPTDNFDIKVYGGSLAGNCSWRGGEIFDATIGGGSTYVLGLAVTRFVGCTFGTGITIDNTNTPTLEMDTFSHSTFISNGVVFGGTVIVLS